MRRAPASSAFSTSSLTTDAGRSTTSPAAIWSASAGGRTRTFCRDPGASLIARTLARHALNSLSPRKRQCGRRSGRGAVSGRAGDQVLARTADGALDGFHLHAGLLLRAPVPLGLLHPRFARRHQEQRVSRLAHDDQLDRADHLDVGPAARDGQALDDAADGVRRRWPSSAETSPSGRSCSTRKSRMWLRITGPAWFFGSPTGLTSIDILAGRRGGCPARPLPARPHRRHCRSRAAHRAPCGARSGPDREARPARRRARGRADQPERSHRAGAHGGMRILRRDDQRGQRMLLAQLAEDQRGLDPDLVGRIVDQRILDVLDLRRLRGRSRRRRTDHQRQRRASIESDEQQRASGRRVEDACKACSGSPGRAIAVNGKTQRSRRPHR